jgi:Uma2 family endonuclease
LIQANLVRELGVHYKKIYSIASELSLQLSDWPSVPDICIFPKASLDLQNDVVAITTAPLCAIEITSPSQSLSDMVAKARAYFSHGVKSCWIVMLPLGNIYVFSGPDEYEIYRSNQTLRDNVLDISIPLNEVFE